MRKIVFLFVLWNCGGFADQINDIVDCDFEKDFCRWNCEKTIAQQLEVLCYIDKFCPKTKATYLKQDRCAKLQFNRNHLKWQRVEQNFTYGTVVLLSNTSLDKENKEVTEISDLVSEELGPYPNIHCLSYRQNLTGGTRLVVAHTKSSHDFINLDIMAGHTKESGWSNTGYDNLQERGYAHLPIQKRFKIVFRAIHQGYVYGGSAILDNIRVYQGRCLDICSSEEFRCDDGHCINSSKVCNNVMDCYDGSDEQNCDLANQSDITLRGCESTEDIKLSRDCRSPNITVSVKSSPTRSAFCYKMDANISSSCDNSTNNCIQSNQGNCILNCPKGCICRDFNFKCSTPYVPEVARTIAITGVNIPKTGFRIHTYAYLVNLRLVNCSLRSFKIEKSLVHLQTLDLSNNNIHHVSSSYMDRLLVFHINQNPVNTTTWFGSIRGIQQLQLKNISSNQNYWHIGSYKYDIDMSNNYMKESIITADSWDSTILLNHCSIHSLNNSVINCHTLDLRSNYLKNFAVSVKVNQLLLQNNLLKEMIDYADAPQMNFLTYLDLENNTIEKIEERRLSYFANLRKLSLRRNRIVKIDDRVFVHQTLLGYLDLSFNKIQHITKNSLSGLTNLEFLYLQHNKISQLQSDMFSSLQRLLSLDLSYNGIEIIHPNTFRGLASLKTLLLNKNNILLKRGMFDGLLVLDFLHVDDFTLCCAKPVTVPKDHCITPSNDISSCDQLIDVPLLRVCIWYMALLALFGNVTVIAYRILTWESSPSKTQAFLTINLSCADLLMGVYLYILAITDMYYTGNYGFADHDWRNGNVCKLAGILSTLSSESSAILLFLISIDRVIAIKLGIKGKKLSPTHCKILSILAWGISSIIALVPAFEKTYFHSFYSSSGVCISLPLSVVRKPGWEFSMMVFVGFNFILCLGILICQILIFEEVVKIGRTIKNTKSKQREIAVAKTLFAVVFTDMLCWIPIGIIGLMTFFGVNVTSQIYAWIVVVILPLNSALNPLLYTVVIVIRTQGARNSTDGKNKSKRCENKNENVQNMQARKAINSENSKEAVTPQSSTRTHSEEVSQELQNKDEAQTKF